MTKRPVRDLDERVLQLLQDPQYAGHPLRAALEEMHEHMRDTLGRIERITALSDAFQSMAMNRQNSLSERFDRQLRRLAKVVSISDRYQGAMRDMNAAIIEASNRDPLTELPNRRALMAQLRDQCQGGPQANGGFVVAMLDVDHFKRVNDVHGHEAGDYVLIELARIMDRALHKQGVCGRWGGEEFLVIFPLPDRQKARQALLRLLGAVRAAEFAVGQEKLKLTVSLGVAVHGMEESLSATLNRADAALYQAKQAGRDRLVESATNVSSVAH